MAITLNGTTGVTAAEFDGTVDASNLTGSLPAIDGSALTGIDTSPPTTAGAVGTYVWARGPASNTATTPWTFGSTYAGSSLYASGFVTSAANLTGGYIEYAAVSIGIGDQSDPSLSGTWRAMGGTTTTSSVHDEMPTTLFVRIS